MIDLRSDTVTKPTPEMRRVMAQAEVGDDVYGEDPTVNRLQEKAAELLGFAAALFVPSGTMGNQVAIAVHTKPGQEVVVEAQSHIYNVEMATMARFSGVQPRAVWGERGVITAEQVRAVIRPNLYYLAQTGLVCLENTHNAGGGRIFPVATAREILEVAHAHGIPVHLDGARIFNAAVALGVPAAELARGFDSLMFCLSKGLGAPVGSMLCGAREFIAEARRVRKALGGGMRQVGILAAAGLHALTHHIDRLAEDHANARILAAGLSQIPCLSVTPPETNIVLVEVVRGPTAPELAERLQRRGVLVAPAGAGTALRKLRLVTHLDITRQDILRTIDLFWEELRGV